MKKKINTKPNNIKKNIISIIIIFIFLIFLSSFFILSNRNYSILERTMKSLSSSFNTFFINEMYSTRSFNSNIINSKILYLEKENNELKKDLSISKNNDNIVFASVINHSLNTWFNKVDINKGKKSNIKEGAPVINQEGLVGFISKTSNNISEVNLLTNVGKDNLISVIIQTDNNNIAGVLCDYKPFNNSFIVKDIMYQDEILAGSKVVLSGFNHESYKGIYIGIVKKEIVSNYGLSKTIEVESSVNFDDLLFVGVITNND